MVVNGFSNDSFALTVIYELLQALLLLHVGVIGHQSLFSLLVIVSR